MCGEWESITQNDRTYLMQKSAACEHTSVNFKDDYVERSNVQVTISQGKRYLLAAITGKPLDLP